jgi:hypothetical protein
VKVMRKRAGRPAATGAAVCGRNERKLAQLFRLLRAHA